MAQVGVSSSHSPENLVLHYHAGSYAMLGICSGLVCSHPTHELSRQSFASLVTGSDLWTAKALTVYY